MKDTEVTRLMVQPYIESRGGYIMYVIIFSAVGSYEYKEVHGSCQHLIMKNKASKKVH